MDEIYKKMDLLKDLKMPPLNFSFAMICIIHKMLAMLKNHLNFLKVVFSNSFFKDFNFFKDSFFHNI